METEVVFPEPRGLTVGVDTTAADRRRDRVHLSYVAVFAFFGSGAEGLRLDQGIRA